MDNKSYVQFLIMKAKIYAKRQDCDEKMKKYDSKLYKLTEMVEKMMDQSQIYNYSPKNMDSTKAQNHTTTVPANKKAPPSEGGNSTKNVGMWTLKHDISSPKFY